MAKRRKKIMDETQEILNDPKLMKSIRQGEKDMREGRTISWEVLKKELKWDGK